MSTIRQHIPVDVDAPTPPVYAEQLHLPSDLTPEVRRAVCEDTLVQVEAQLREADCFEQLSGLCSSLNARVIINGFKARNAVGQRENTRSHQALTTINNKILQHKHEYRASRAALLALRGPGNWEQSLRELRDEDVRCINERTLTAQELHDHEEAMRLAQRLDGVQGVAVDSAAQVGDGLRSLSWIWLSADPGSVPYIVNLEQEGNLLDVNLEGVFTVLSRNSFGLHHL